MKKLKLDIEELSVESFRTGVAQEREGTVLGQATTVPCLPPTRLDDTCWASCVPGCGTYFCATEDHSCGEFSCVWTCADSCGPASEPCYSCIAGAC